MLESNKKVIISDLDGTLLNNDHQVSHFTKQVLKQIHDQGNTLVIATGRHHLDAMPILSWLCNVMPSGEGQQAPAQQHPHSGHSPMAVQYSPK